MQLPYFPYSWHSAGDIDRTRLFMEGEEEEDRRVVIALIVLIANVSIVL
jgi:hypothetical protein